jgi:acyl carrier protein
MTETSVLDLIAETLRLPPGELKPESQAGDFQEWDSIGSISLLVELDRRGIRFDPGDTLALQSVSGIVGAFRKAGKLL